MLKSHNKSFNLKLYEGIINEALGLGFSFQTFSGYLKNKIKKTILIRHDVDFSLELAMKMARVEYELGIHTTYFVRVHSTRYNPFDQHNYRRLHELKNKGFEIGVHQEVCNFAQTEEDALLLLKREKKVIENILNHSVNGVATHLPKRNLMKITPDILMKTGFRYAAGGEIFNRDALFVSDSKNHWKKYSFKQALRLSDKILANIHPVWWVGEVADSKSIIKFLREGN